MFEVAGLLDPPNPNKEAATRRVLWEKLFLKISRKARGHDDISIRIIKICNNLLFRPLSLLIKISFDNFYFPELWEKLNIIPVHKKMVSKILKIIALFHCSQFSENYILKNVHFSSNRTTLKGPLTFYFRIFLTAIGR